MTDAETKASLVPLSGLVYELIMSSGCCAVIQIDKKIINSG